MLLRLFQTLKKISIDFLIEMDIYGNSYWSKNISDNIEISYPNMLININDLVLINNNKNVCIFGRSFKSSKTDSTVYKLLLMIYDTKGNFIEKYNWNSNPLDSTSEHSIFDVLDLSNGNLLLTVLSNNGMKIEFLEIKPKLTSNNENEEFIIKSLLYPNPAIDKLTFFQIPNGTVSYEIFDIFGERVLSTPSSLRDATPQEGNFKIDVSFLPPGIYFLKLNNQVKPIKFVKI